MPYGKTTRRIRLLRKQDPEIKAIDLARITGVSRERVRQILINLNLPTRLPLASCGTCGVRITPQRYKLRGICVKCYTQYRKKLSDGLRGIVKCDRCGTSIWRLHSLLKRNRYFTLCSRACWYAQRKGRHFRILQ